MSKKAIFRSVKPNIIFKNDLKSIFPDFEGRRECRDRNGWFTPSPPDGSTSEWTTRLHHAWVHPGVTTRLHPVWTTHLHPGWTTRFHPELVHPEVNHPPPRGGDGRTPLPNFGPWGNASLPYPLRPFIKQPLQLTNQKFVSLQLMRLLRNRLVARGAIRLSFRMLKMHTKRTKRMSTAQRDRRTNVLGERL